MSVSSGTTLTVGSGSFTMASGQTITPYPVISGVFPLPAVVTPISGIFSSPYKEMIRSGWGTLRPTCWKCNTEIWDNSVTVTGISGLMMMFCHSCAGYNYQSGGFSWQREAWIRESVPQCDAGMPAEILADWLEEQGRLGDANYLRKLQQEKGER